jgi:hypothetical protein
MRPQFLDWPGEFLAAVLLAASPIVGAIWVTPDVTKWSVFGVGVAMVVATILVGLKPVKKPQR